MSSTSGDKLRRDPMIRFRQLQASCNARRRGPVHKLPVEILTQILANALAEETDNPYLLQDLSQVCSQWRSIIADAPLLYRSFRLENPTLTARHLERSRGLPLDVDIHDVKLSKMSAWVLGMLEDFPHRKLTSLSFALTRQEKPVSLRLPDSEEARQTFRRLTSLKLCNLNIGRALLEPSDLQHGHISFSIHRLELEFTLATPPTNATLITS